MRKNINNTNTIINLKNINFKYSKLKVLDNINMSVSNGVFGLLGPNGAGKTTLMKIILGFLKPLSGNGSVLNFNILTKTMDIRRSIGYMPEVETTLPEMDGISSVSYLGELSGMSKNDSMKRAHEVLFYVGLEDQRYRKVVQYSSGMKQKLKLAQAIVHDPKILFLDEPTSGMDPQGRKDILNLIKDISNSTDMNIIFSTHILSDIEETCKNVIIINNGKILSVDSLSNLEKENLNIFELKLKGNIDNFLKIIRQMKFNYKIDERGIYRIYIPSSFSPNEFFNIGYKCKTQIRHFRKSTSTLEDKFLKVIEKSNRGINGN